MAEAFETSVMGKVNIFEHPTKNVVQTFKQALYFSSFSGSKRNPAEMK